MVPMKLIHVRTVKTKNHFTLQPNVKHQNFPLMKKLFAVLEQEYNLVADKAKEEKWAAAAQWVETLTK
jgi:hypothetical protein